MADPKAEFEEAEILAYSESDNQVPTYDDRKAYYLKRYHTIKEVYTFLKLQQDEAKAYKDAVQRDNAIARVQKLFRENYTERVAVVTELRKLGEKVADPFIPLSKI